MSPADPLAQVPILSALDAPARGRLVSRLGRLSLPAGAAVFERGAPGDLLYLVESGEAEIFLPAEPGSPRVTLRRLGPGDHFGELALIDGAPRIASAAAATPLTLLTLERESFLDGVLASPAGARAVVAELASRLRATNTLLSERASRDVVGELDASRTLSERLAEQVARWNGSWGFLGFLVLFSGAWALYNSRSGAFDPYPFAFFNLVLAVLVVLQGPLLMMAQNREARAERAAARADYRVNLKNELALERLLREVEALRRPAGRDSPPPAAG